MPPESESTIAPSLFVSHGSPRFILDDSPARRFLAGLGEALPRPLAILCVSAHWETRRPTASTAERPETIHDFYGFPQALYQIRYPAAGAPGAARRAAELLEKAGFACDLDSGLGLDHGAWVPLSLMYPNADVPVTQLSIQHVLGPAHHLAVGRALAPLRDEGVMILGSGSATHNLRRLGNFETVPGWARGFDDWLAATVEAGDAEALADYRRRAPDAATAHPRDEHLLPIMVAMGAGGNGARGRILHRSFMDGSLSMAAYAFDRP